MQKQKPVEELSLKEQLEIGLQELKEGKLIKVDDKFLAEMKQHLKTLEKKESMKI